MGIRDWSSDVGSSDFGKLLTINGTRTREALAGRNVVAVLSGHIHDPFDLTAQTPAGPLRMIGAGTLSKRIRSTPPSFNEIVIDGDDLRVEARNLEHVATADMQIRAVPENALPPRDPGEPVAPAGTVPPADRSAERGVGKECVRLWSYRWPRAY